MTIYRIPKTIEKTVVVGGVSSNSRHYIDTKYQQVSLFIVERIHKKFIKFLLIKKYSWNFLRRGPEMGYELWWFTNYIDVDHKYNYERKSLTSDQQKQRIRKGQNLLEGKTQRNTALEIEVRLLHKMIEQVVWNITSMITYVTKNGHNYPKKVWLFKIVNEEETIKSPECY